MRKVTTSLALISGMLLPLLAKAQCYVNGKEVPCGQFWDSFGWAFILMGIVLVVFFAFWIWMLVHMIKNSIPNKVMWIVLMLVPSINGIIPFVYYFMVKRKFDRGEMRPQSADLNSNLSQQAFSGQPMPNSQSGGFCPACGAPITSEMAFCGKCGNRFK